MRACLLLGFVSVALVGLVGCGGAAPAPRAPTEIAVVNLDNAKPVNGKPARAKGEEGKMGAPAAPEKGTDPRAARIAALKEAAESGILGVLSNLSGSDGVFGGVVGGVLDDGGTAFGAGGLGLSGVGAGGGGTGSGTIGLGSIGTIGRGGGGGSGYGSGAGGSSHRYSIVGPSTFGSNGLSGQSIYISGNTVIELGDTLTLGVSLEMGAGTMRNRVYSMRDCYRTGLEKNKLLAGSVGMRLIVGKEGNVVLARELFSDLPGVEVVSCLRKAFDGAYVGRPADGVIGVVESVVHFSTHKP